MQAALCIGGVKAEQTVGISQSTAHSLHSTPETCMCVCVCGNRAKLILSNAAPSLIMLVIGIDR